MMDRRRNETRLLDLNTELSSKNSALKKQLMQVTQDYSMDCLPEGVECRCWGKD